MSKDRYSYWVCFKITPSLKLEILTLITSNYIEVQNISEYTSQTLKNILEICWPSQAYMRTLLLSRLISDLALNQ